MQIRDRIKKLYPDMHYAEHAFSILVSLGWECDNLAFLKDASVTNIKPSFHSLRGALAKEVQRGRIHYVQGNLGMFPQTKEM